MSLLVKKNKKNFELKLTEYIDRAGSKLIKRYVAIIMCKFISIK